MNPQKALYRAIHRLPMGRRHLLALAQRIPGLALPTSVEVRTVFGTQMRINPSDNSLERSVYMRGIYEVQVTSFLLHVLPRIPVFWDVGAHVGYHTLLASHAMGPGSRVVAYEPHPRVFGLLNENTRCFGGGNLELLNVGLSDEDTEKEIFDEGEGVTRAPTFVEGIFEPSGHRCRLRSGDALLSSTELMDWPLLIKIDVEGYEDRMLKGLAGLLSSATPPIVIFELNRRFNPDPSAVLNRLADCNRYEFFVESREHHARRYPIRRKSTDGPVLGFVRLDPNNVPYQCNVLAYCRDAHHELFE